MRPTTVTVDQHVGNRIRARRLELHISQQSLGAAIGVSFQQLQKYESGVNRVAGVNLVNIANTLHKPVSYFYDGAPGLSLGNGGHGGAVEAFISSIEGVAIAESFAHIASISARRTIARMVMEMAALHLQAAE